MADKKQNLVKYGEVVARCWEDEAYKKRFIEDPEGVLSEAGFVVDEGVTYKVIQQPKTVKYLVLPHAGTKDAVQEITKQFLNRVEKSDAVIPEGAEVRIIQNTDDMRYMILPASPKTLSAAELKMAAGGDGVTIAPNVSTTVISPVAQNIVVAAEAAQTTSQTMADTAEITVNTVVVLI